jgi:hypothetical protein
MLRGLALRGDMLCGFVHDRAIVSMSGLFWPLEAALPAGSINPFIPAISLFPFNS